MFGQQELQPLKGSRLPVELGGLSSDYLQRTYSREPTTPLSRGSSDCQVRPGAMGSRTPVILLWWDPHANMTTAALLQVQLRTSPGCLVCPGTQTSSLALHCTKCHMLIHRPQSKAYVSPVLLEFYFQVKFPSKMLVCAVANAMRVATALPVSANLAGGLYSITTCGSSLLACLLEPSRAFWRELRIGKQREHRQLGKRGELQGHTWFVFDFGLFKKQKAKKKKPTNKQLYIQSQTETTDYGKRQELWETEEGWARANTTF